MTLFRRIALLACLLLPVLALVPAVAQEEELPVLILPIDNANFLPGAMFDFRVEVHTAELPENFMVMVNGTPAAEFFGAEPTAEAWEFGGKVASFKNDGAAPADFSLEALATSYYNTAFGAVEVVVDGETLKFGADTTLEATDNPLIFTAVGGQADGMPVEFGYDADGKLTGFTVAGQNFGVLTSLPTKSSSVIWRGVMLPEVGEYTVEVTAGATIKTVTWVVRQPVAGAARNVILFIGDGMSIPMITAVRAASLGITQGKPNGRLTMEQLDSLGLASTSSVDSIMADSANTASALNTGHVGSVNATGTYSDTSPDTLDDPRVETFAQMIKRARGMSVGVVTTADFSDATPAAVWAHGRNRADLNRNTYLVQALEQGTVDVLMGGGARRMIPKSVEGSRRGDERDLFAEYEEAGFTIATTATELTEAMAETPEKLLGVFTPSDMNVWLDRNVYTENLGDFTDQPGLVDMTMAAIEVLSQNENGFYLEVEAASIDKQMHSLDQERTLSDLIELDKAVAAAVAWAAENAPDTLIIVTADHAHGYEVYGTVNVEKFNAAETEADKLKAVGVYNAAGYPTYTDEDGDGFPNWEASVVFAGLVNNHPTYTEDFQVSSVPRSPATTDADGNIIDNPDDDPNGILLTGNLSSRSGVHTLQDIPVFAGGPGADFFRGTYHQSEVFFGMAAAIGLDLMAEDGKAE